MTVERASRVGERPRAAAFLLSAALLSVLLGFRLGMHRQDAVGYGLQIPAPGLDLSYTYAMNRASAQGRVFGREFISTYGPFGHVIAAMDVGRSLWPWILSQVVLTAGLGLAAGAHVLGTRGPGWSSMGLALLVLVTIHVLADEHRWLSLVVLVALLGLHAEGRWAIAAFAAAGVLAGLGLLVKLSLGLGALLSVGAAALFARRGRAIAWRSGAAVLAAVLGLLAGLGLYQGSLDGLGDYVKTAVAVTSGYSSAMSLAPSGGGRIASAFALFVALLGVVAALVPSRARRSVAVFGLPLFIAWKHALVRQDQHIQIFVAFGLVVVAIALVDASWEALRRAGPFLLLGVAALVFAWTDSPASGPRPLVHLGQTLGQPLLLPGLRGVLTLADLPGYRAKLARESSAALLPLRLPEEARAVVGTETVDVYPWEASYLAANDLRWASRPSPASFATYTPALDARNAAFFESDSRPRFLLWHKGGDNRSIDRRQLFWDEPLTMLNILDRYEVAWRGQVTLLKERRERRFAPPELVRTVGVAWGEWLTLPEVRDGLLAEVVIDMPFGSRLRRAFLREDPALVAVRFANGERKRFRYLPDQAASGFWLQPLPRNADDVHAIFGGECPKVPVEAIRFIGGFRPGARGPRITFWRVRGARARC